MKRGFGTGWETSDLVDGPALIRRGDKVASAGNGFAANLVPALEWAGVDYVRRDVAPAALADVAADNLNYARFSAAYGNIDTARQAAQMFKRALGRFKPAEDRWVIADDRIVDPFRPGLKYPATSHREFDLLTAQHLANVLDVVRAADVFVFTLGSTEAWVSTLDGAVFPARPGTIAGIFDPARHVLRNFSACEVAADVGELLDLVREVNPRIRVVLTAWPVPLVATATDQHALVAAASSASVLRDAAEEAAQKKSDVTYFPAYEIVAARQAPFEFHEAGRREPSDRAIRAAMCAFLSRCETDLAGSSDNGGTPGVEPLSRSGDKPAADGSARAIRRSIQDMPIFDSSLYRSQYGQDRFVYEFLMPFRGGTFLEAGALDGEKLSNTFFFEHALDWSGILIEMKKDFFATIEAKRPRSRCYNCALASERSERLYLDAFGLSGLLASMGAQAIGRIEKLFRGKKSQLGLSWVDAVPLMEILDKERIEKIDYFSLDVEGAEMEILRSIDFTRLRVNLFGIEDNYGRGAEAAAFLRPLGYQMLPGHLGADRFFVRTDFFEQVLKERPTTYLAAMRERLR